MEVLTQKVEDYLRTISYAPDLVYTPSPFAIEFVNFIKLVEGGDPENKTPVVHYRMIDNFISDDDRDTLNMCHRGIAKSTLKEYLILYLGVFGILPEFGAVPYALYVSDSIDNGVKKMRKALEYRWQNSEFLQQYIPEIKFTDIRWEFLNMEGKSFVVSGYGAKTGVRGTRENGTRPILALLDDLISDSDARSATVIADVEDTVYKAIDYALHPKRRKIIWSGTPFNAKDPLYKAVESGAWNVNVYPVCERYPCTREEFRGSWEDRFDYDYVKKQYEKAVKLGKVDTFNQELMLRIMSDEDRLIQDADIGWYKRATVLANRGRFNFYITTDFATSEKTASDFSVISVWAYSSAGHWFWVDGVVKKQLMDANVDDLFRLAQMYKPQQVGIEVVDGRDELVRAHDVGGRTRCCGVLEGIARRALRGVRTDREPVLDVTRLHQATADEHRLRAGLARSCRCRFDGGQVHDQAAQARSVAAVGDLHTQPLDVMAARDIFVVRPQRSRCTTCLWCSLIPVDES